MKTYNTIFIALVCLVTGLSASIMLWSQPISGDLTRISGYPERWFGWNAPQQNITSVINSPRQPGKPHILVIGDSFSEAGRWQSLLADQYSFSFIHSGKTTLKNIQALTGNNRPDAIVIETGERAIFDMYGRDSTFLHAANTCSTSNSASEPADNTHQIDNINAAIAALPTFPPLQRRTQPGSMTSISEGFHIFKLYGKTLLKPKKAKAKILPLTTNQLFSNQKSDQLLALSRDFLLYDQLDEQNLQIARCSIRTISQIFTDARLPHALLILPDKTTAYQTYLVDEKLRQQPALITQFDMRTLSPHGINMLSPIRTLIAAGNKDVYLPNDTHWGYKGFQLAAALLNKELTPQLQKQ